MHFNISFVIFGPSPGWNTCSSTKLLCTNEKSDPMSSLLFSYSHIALP
uniref:Uncharacterized protein n=1 Tax=Rhizophora mucronata TaxID=61149 RepID=A0A2P2NMY5_RHIMU